MRKGQSPVHTAKKILLGTTLGDACIAAGSPTKAYLIMNHGIDQLPYLIWKMQMLSPVVGTFAVNMYQRRGENEWSTKPKVSAWTLSSKYLKHIYDDFYFERDGKTRKEVHENVLRKLSAESLAVWYMDDGSLGRSKYGKECYMTLAMCSYTDEECERTIKYMSDVWDLYFYPYKHIQGFNYIYGDVDSTRKFIKIVQPHICPYMMYKIDPSRSAEHLDSHQGEEMIRTLEQSRELVRNNQPAIRAEITDEVKERLQGYIKNVPFRWSEESRFNSDKNNIRFLMYDSSDEDFNLMKSCFGGTIQKIYNRFKYSNGRKSATEMLSVLDCLQQN